MALCFSDRGVNLLDALPHVISGGFLSSKKDPFGFRFWLVWILGFILTFLLSAFAWTQALTFLFEKIDGNELTLTWSFCVFGTWFLLLIPFMRKKEQVWKRLNLDQEIAVDAWLKGMGIFLGTVMLLALFWSWFYRGEILSYSGKWFEPRWAKALLGTSLMAILPFLVWMYRKADQIFKNAVDRQTDVRIKFRTQFVEKENRLLTPQMAAKVAEVSETINRGHIVHVWLKDGRAVPHVFIFNQSEVLGVYDRDIFDFSGTDIERLEVINPQELANYDESKWLRIDLER